jgi:Ca2+-binding RTX toxin-like protein
MSRFITRALPGAALCVALLAFAPGAFGATVALNGATITYTAAAGEENNLTIDQGAGNITFDELAIGITAGAGCTAAAGDASCPEAGVTSIVVNTADKNDDVSATSNVLVPLTAALGDDSDFIFATKNADVIDGGPGRDDLRGAAGADTVNGGVGSDFIDGGAGNDTLHGDDGADDIQGGSGDDQFFGDAGEDFLRDDSGADAFNGGAGRDLLDARDDQTNESWTQDGVANDGAPAEGDNWGTDVEDLELADGDNTVVAGPGDNRLDLGVGSDVVDGGAGADQIDTSGGDDIVQGGDGPDVINSSDGNDVIDGGAGGDELFAGDGNDVVRGGADADLLSGGADADALDGGTGTDFLYGGDGPDTIGGGADADTVDFTSEVRSVFVSIDGVANDGFAGEGDNVLTDVENIIGGSGDDVLGGSTAVNSIDGGPGNDSIAVRDRSADQVTCGAGIDAVVADALDSIDPSAGSCESVDRGVVAGLGRKLRRGGVSVRKGRARIAIVCPLDALGGCAGTARLKRSGKSAGSASFITPTATKVTVSIKLPKAVARLVARGKRVKVTLTISGSDLRAPLAAFQTKVTLKR